MFFLIFVVSQPNCIHNQSLASANTKSNPEKPIVWSNKILKQKYLMQYVKITYFRIEENVELVSFSNLAL